MNPDSPLGVATPILEHAKGSERIARVARASVTSYHSLVPALLLPGTSV